ncbi:MAG: 6,7-dimethyl-8-ribityllumazine synthase [Chlamydiales bacterium]|nr:6,7-dimethyl-8-ribityllumazine synthase [Chlamydiales bacterium]MCH9619410.1 6,7-dimethyl-8-ribityllumazine synthase [Chlamydiales bacterium]MCH9622214.1 6,7-dimethyl-8-ribityllumazine synthase [Chlamydiales bacterium]
MHSTSALVEGIFDATGIHFALVAARFNREITQKLVDGARDCLVQHGACEPELIWVPGAFELPLIAKKMAESGKYGGVICLGAVIRGETAHFEHVASQAASGILHASLSTDVPVIFSVLTTETVAQAEARSGAKEGNAGFSGALTAIEMAHVMKHLSNRELCDLKN